MPLGSLVLAALLAASPTPAATVHFPVTVGTYSSFVTGATRQRGLFDVLTKDDQIYFDLRASDLNRPFILEAGIARGIGPEAFTGRALDSMPITFVRRDNRILWEVPNANFVAGNDATAKRDLALSVSDSIVGSSPILAEDKAGGRVVIAPTPLVADFEHVVALLNPRGPALPGTLAILAGGGAYSFDGGETYAQSVKAFPDNVDLFVNLGLDAPENAPPSIADPRGFRIVMHYSFIARPLAGGYVPRAADDRVGFFDDTLKDLSDTRAESPFVRYIARWDMRRKPIVFYLTSEVPKAYRGAVRRGVLAWNAAFDRIGIHDAIEVRNQPDDPSWDPDDARYSTIRWITSDTPAFGAYTGFYSDPYTGEIFRAEIVVDGEYLRTVRTGYQNDVMPALTETGGEELGAQAAQQAGFSAIAARALGQHLDADRFVRQFVEAEVMHETGHALGLRHNFKGSALYSLAQIDDAAFTEAHGLSASVMDYLPVNVAPPGTAQGAYFQLALGPYDDWAIRYGYAPSIDPRSVARLSAQPAYRYGSDEDGMPLSDDPLAAPFDLSSDPLAYDAQQLSLTQSVLLELDSRYAQQRRPYYDERLAFYSALQNELRSALLAARYVGGEYTSRTHRGQPDAHPPFTPIPRALSQRAFNIIARAIFAPRALTFSSAFVRDLGPDYFHGWGIEAPLRAGVPVVGISGAIQDAVLDRLFATINVARIYDVEAGGGNAMRLQDLFQWARTAAFSEFPAHPDAASEAHRELQRHFIDLMIAYQGAPTALLQNVGVPREAQALARYELEQVDGTVTAALARHSLGVATRAHLEDLQSRARRALHGVNVISP